MFFCKAAFRRLHHQASTCRVLGGAVQALLTHVVNVPRRQHATLVFLHLFFYYPLPTLLEYGSCRMASGPLSVENSTPHLTINNRGRG